jgi:1,4-dihydroxy-2-naphthoate octaprenyltransferase
MNNNEPNPAPLNPFVKWFLAARAPFWTASIIPVLIGAAAARFEAGVFDGKLLALTLLGAVLAHSGANMANDYFDDRSGNDRVNRYRSMFSGGTGMIQAGIVSGKEMLTAALCAFAGAAAVGIVLANLRGWPVVALALFGGLCGFFYTAGPVKLAYRGAGEYFLGLAFGPALVLGAYYVQAGAVTPLALLSSVPIGLLVVAILYINQFPDYEADRAAHKYNAVVRLGRRAALPWYYALLAVAYAWLVLAIFLGAPWVTIFALATVPVAIGAARTAARHHDDPVAILPANAMTIVIHLLTGLLQAGGFAVAAALGA